MGAWVKERKIMENAVNFAWPVTSVDKGDYKAFCIWFDANEKMLRERQLIIWGAGIRGTEFAIFLKNKEYYNIVFIDSNSQKWGGYIDEFPIFPPEELEIRRARGEKNKILISIENSKEVEKELEQKGYGKGKDFFVIQAYPYENYMTEFQRIYTPEVLIMGDCEFSTISIKDKDDRNLQEMIQERCGIERTKVLAMHGMGLRAHYNIFHSQLLLGMKPRYFLIMVNLDTLTGKQHLLPRSQHAELMQMIYDRTKPKTEEFTEYVNLVWERSKKMQAEFFTSKRKEKTRMALEIKARNYVKLNYLYDLDIHTEGLIYLVKIVKEALAEGVKVLPFLPPVNYQLGIKLFGEEFKEKYERNIKKIRMLLLENQTDLLDLSYQFPSELFAEPTTPDETVNEEGRRQIAECLCNSIELMKSGVDR